MRVRSLRVVVYLMLCASGMVAQSKKGDMSLSVTASPFPTTYGDNDDFGVIGLAGFEFFLSNRVSLMGSFFSSNNTIIRNDSGATIRSYGFIPSIQYYFVNKEDFNIFGNLGYGFGFEDLTRGVIQNSALTVFSIGPGVNYKLHEKLFLRLTLPYFNARNITIDENAANGIAVFLGLEFKL
ncbi:MAG: hypothetical protein ACI83B_001266 [Sediminicola sp.]|jgi:hypothetical protein|uniref:outer membrane beta-barrel protein n=1 Tax=Nonlabens sp. TaxID=1888209 RepID=UPI0039E4D1FA